MSSRPHHSPPPIPDSASSPTSPSHRPVDGCATSTRSPLASPMTMFWKRACAMAGYGRPMRREYPQALPGSTIHDTPTPEVFTWKQIALIVTCAHTVYVRSVVAGTPVAGPVRYVSHLFHSSPCFPFPWAAIYHRVTRHTSRHTHTSPLYPTILGNKSFISYSQMTWIRGLRNFAFHPLFYLSPLLSWRGARSRECAALAAPDAPGLPAKGLCAALWPRERFVRIRDIPARALYHSFAPRLGECDCERTQS
jgi:hypothetical protein